MIKMKSFCEVLNKSPNTSYRTLFHLAHKEIRYNRDRDRRKFYSNNNNGGEAARGRSCHFSDVNIYINNTGKVYILKESFIMIKDTGNWIQIYNHKN